MRFIVWLLVHTVYRMRQRGLEHLPATGPGVVVSNHVSFVDALVLAAASRRPLRFVMDHTIFRLPVLSFVFRTARAIPIAPRKEDPELLERAYAEIGRALDDGDLVCIFPEGRITTTGEMNPFRPGIERILARNPCRWCRWRCAASGAASSAARTGRRCRGPSAASGRASRSWPGRRWRRRARRPRRSRSASWRCAATGAERAGAGQAGRALSRADRTSSRARSIAVHASASAPSSSERSAVAPTQWAVNSGW